MIVVSLNVRGVGGAPKFLALKWFIALVKPDILFIQETMVSELKAREIFAKLLPTWKFCGVDSLGLSGGLLSAWNPRRDDFSSFLTPAGILLDGLVKDLNKRMKLINCYDPYGNKQEFWDKIKRDGILKEHNLILGGDLNFTISNREVWGPHSRSDPMNSFFSQLIQEEGLVDVEPVKLLPTWRNGRGDQDYIAKRLDHFLINEELALSGLRYRSWVGNIKISDHMPMIFHLEQEKEKYNYPFKFNYVWLDEPDFVNLVRSTWNKLLVTEDFNPMDSLVQKLKLLKSVVIKWERNKKSWQRRN
jgi:exonuclease III